MPIRHRTTRFVGIDFTNLELDETVAAIRVASAGSHFTTVVTPNVDHVVRMDRMAKTPTGDQYVAAVKNADLCLCDSRILARLARLQGIVLCVVPGSDLTAGIFADVLKPGNRIAVVGGDADTIGDLAVIMPGVQVTQHIPPMGLLHDDHALTEAAEFICSAKAQFTFVAVGSPQGEILLHHARLRGAGTGVALSIGASIDFLTGRQRRAPRLLQKLGLEWAFRLCTEPKRLWRRYLVDGPRIFAIVMRGGDR